MMPRPDGSLVQINPYDYSGEEPGPSVGDYIRTYGTKGGTTYEIVEIRRVQTRKRLPRPYHTRYAIVARKLGRNVGRGPNDARLFTMAWNPRNKRRDVR